jgi:hypothetical protein
MTRAWQPGKMAARLQAATASDKPVLLRVDFDAGHGVGSTKKQHELEMPTSSASFYGGWASLSSSQTRPANTRSESGKSIGIACLNPNAQISSDSDA